MKKLFLTFVLAILATVSFSQNHVHVNGYYRKNGTYVQPHHRTAPNNTVRDNWSTAPNVNPYTGKVGTKHYNTPTSTPTQRTTPKTTYTTTPRNYNSSNKSTYYY